MFAVSLKNCPIIIKSTRRHPFLFSFTQSKWCAEIERKLFCLIDRSITSAIYTSPYLLLLLLTMMMMQMITQPCWQDCKSSPLWMDSFPSFIFRLYSVKVKKSNRLYPYHHRLSHSFTLPSPLHIHWKPQVYTINDIVKLTRLSRYTKHLIELATILHLSTEKPIGPCKMTRLPGTLMMIDCIGNVLSFKMKTVRSEWLTNDPLIFKLRFKSRECNQSQWVSL